MCTVHYYTTTVRVAASANDKHLNRGHLVGPPKQTGEPKLHGGELGQVTSLDP